MIIVEQHIYKKTNKHYPLLDKLCFLSKNLYNSTLYAVRQHYFETGKYLNYFNVNKLFLSENQKDYRAFPSRVGNMTQKLVDTGFKSFFALLKLKKQGKYNKSVNMPKYLKKDGRQVVHYTNKALLRKEKGFIGLSGIPLSDFKIKVEDNKKIKFIRIIPKGGYIILEIAKEIQEPPLKINNNYAAIDLGINNLATVTSNVMQPFIINGKPLKSINQYYNKKYSKLKSEVNGRYKTYKTYKTTKRMNSLSLKRNNKIKDYLHKASRLLVNHLVSNNISLLIIGYNKGWKQDTNMGNVNNQNFVFIPFLTFIDMLIYKCKLVGIDVVLTEENYTSQCSFIDNEKVTKHKKYAGKRVKRGLFKTRKKKFINADVNGSYNIMKKYLTKKAVWNKKIFLDCIEVCNTPTIFTIK